MNRDHVLQQLGGRLVAQEVCYCVSGLMAVILNAPHQYAELIGDDQAIALSGRAPDAADYRDQAPERVTVSYVEEAAYSGWEWFGPNSDSVYTDDEGEYFATELEAWESAYDTNGWATPDGTSREARLRVARRYLAMRRARAALSYSAEVLSRQHGLAVERAERAEERAAAAETRALSGRSRADRLTRVAVRQRRDLRRAGDDLRGARAEARVALRNLGEARTALAGRGATPIPQPRPLETENVSC